MYFNEVYLDKDQKFILKFGKKDELKKLFFSAKTDYCITSMKTFIIKLHNDDKIKEWQNDKKIKNLHCAKSAQIRSYFRNNYVFGHFSCSAI